MLLSPARADDDTSSGGTHLHLPPLPAPLDSLDYEEDGADASSSAGGGLLAGSSPGGAGSDDEPHYLEMRPAEVAEWLSQVFALTSGAPDVLAQMVKRDGVDGSQLLVMRDTSAVVRRMVLLLWFPGADADEDVLQQKCDVFFAALLRNENDDEDLDGEEEEGENYIVIRTKPLVVRESAALSSNKVAELHRGDGVRVLEEREIDGGVRVRIGENQWATRVNAKGHVLMGLEGSLTGDESKRLAILCAFGWMFALPLVFMWLAFEEGIKTQCGGEPVVEQSRTWAETGIAGAPIWARNTVLAFYAKKGLKRATGFKGSGASLATTLLTGGKAATRKTDGAGWLGLVGTEGVGLGGLQAHVARSSWEDARNALGLDSRQAFSIAVAKLVFWHWSQPVGYLWVLKVYFCELDTTQQILGALVAVREMVYLCMTILAAKACPAYLLLDLKTVWNEAPTPLERAKRISTYALTPHNFVALCLANRFSAAKDMFASLAGFQVACDVASCGALFLLFTHDNQSSEFVPFNITAKIEFFGDSASKTGAYHLLADLESCADAGAELKQPCSSDGQWSLSGEGLGLIGSGWEQMIPQEKPFPQALAIGYSITAFGCIMGFAPAAIAWLLQIGWRVFHAVFIGFVGLAIYGVAYGTTRVKVVRWSDNQDYVDADYDNYDYVDATSTCQRSHANPSGETKAVWAVVGVIFMVIAGSGGCFCAGKTVDRWRAFHRPIFMMFVGFLFVCGLFLVRAHPVVNGSCNSCNYTETCLIDVIATMVTVAMALVALVWSLVIDRKRGARCAGWWCCGSLCILVVGLMLFAVLWLLGGERTELYNVLLVVGAGLMLFMFSSVWCTCCSMKARVPVDGQEVRCLWWWDARPAREAWWYRGSVCILVVGLLLFGLLWWLGAERNELGSDGYGYGYGYGYAVFSDMNGTTSWSSTGAGARAAAPNRSDSREMEHEIRNEENAVGIAGWMLFIFSCVWCTCCSMKARVRAPEQLVTIEPTAPTAPAISDDDGL